MIGRVCWLVSSLDDWLVGWLVGSFVNLRPLAWPANGALQALSAHAIVRLAEITPSARALSTLRLKKFRTPVISSNNCNKSIANINNFWYTVSSIDTYNFVIYGKTI